MTSIRRYAIMAIVALMLPIAAIAQPLVSHVNPMLGTGGHGHTYPGAASPFGMVQLSPDQFHSGWDWCSGYHNSDSIIIGFSHTHFSGTGIGEMGDVSIMPTVGSLKLTYAERKNWQEGYGARFSHSDEIATAGYYRVWLRDTKIQTELTVSPRVGFHRYTFPKTDSARLILNLNHGIGWDWCPDASITIVNDTLITGYRFSTGWANNQLVHFAMVLSKRPNAVGMATDTTVFPNRRDFKGGKARAYFEFKTEQAEEILVKVALSYVSVEGALENLRHEVPHWDFEKTRRQTESAWEKELSRLTIQGASSAEKTTFYTAMYHSMLAPSLYQDADGKYRGSEPKEKKIHTADGFTNYTVFSLWDTFRAWHPLSTLVFTNRVSDFLRSFYAQYEQFGELPVWSLMSNESYVMIGYHSIPIIVDALAKGLLTKSDAEKFFQAMTSSAMKDGRGLKPYRAYGYIPFDTEIESVSKTLEYAYDDWCIASAAKTLNKPAEVAEFSKRAMYYENVFDNAAGFMRGKDSLGRWKSPFNPRNAEHRDGTFTEGNSWQYTWFVPHDVQGLINRVGGREKFVQKLDSLFMESSEFGAGASPDVSGLIGQYAHGNEPSHHVAYLYAYAGAPHKTAERVTQILTELYNHTSEGLCGNEDCGQMSAWYILSALGFYPVNPAEAIYVFGSPRFPKATLALPKGKTLSIEARNVSMKNIYIQSVSLNGKKIETTWVRHNELMNGGKLIFEMGATPHPTWGKTPSAAPPSMSRLK